MLNCCVIITAIILYFFCFKWGECKCVGTRFVLVWRKTNVNDVFGRSFTERKLTKEIERTYLCYYYEFNQRRKKVQENISKLTKKGIFYFNNESSSYVVHACVCVHTPKMIVTSIGLFSCSVFSASIPTQTTQHNNKCRSLKSDFSETRVVYYEKNKQVTKRI